MNRDDLLDRVRGTAEPFDIIVVGGGASGLGAAVDAASRGHSVALFEQSDFAKGTSSRSTKLVHGGVRYLKQGNIGLVLEALRERGRLAENAPHLFHSQSFIIPNYSWWEGPFYGIGMKVYDGMAGRLGLAPSRNLSKQETIERIPTIEQKGLLGGVIYHDGQFDDARLAVNLAQTVIDHGGIALNYCHCAGLTKEAGLISGVEIRDEETGDEFTVRGRCVINATGVFSDSLRQMDNANSPSIIAASQGIHFVLPKRFLPGDAAIMVPKTADGRVLFAVPWKDHVIVGTTDTELNTISLEPRALEEEREFVMTHAGQYLSEDPGPEDVRSVFAGLRPLVRSSEEESTAALSRDHSILISESGLVTLVGGKWTTYRKMAADVVDQAETVADLDSKPCQTVKLKIHGATDSKMDRYAEYGSDASVILDLEKTRPGLDRRIHPDFDLTEAEVRWHATAEMARTVEDVLSRRSRCLLFNAAKSIEAAPAVATLLAGELGRNAEWEKAEVVEYEKLARGYVYADGSSVAPSSCKA